MKEIKERAHARHAEITRLGAIVEERREQEMAKSLEQRDATKMLKFEEQDHALNEHSQQLDRLIHGAWSMEDALRPKWIDLRKEYMSAARHYFRTKGTKRTAPAAVVVAVPSACLAKTRSS